MLAFLTVWLSFWARFCTGAGLLKCAGSSCPAGGAALSLRMRSARRVSRRELCGARRRFPRWRRRTWCWPRLPVNTQSDTSSRGSRPVARAGDGARGRAGGGRFRGERGSRAGRKGLGAGPLGARGLRERRGTARPARQCPLPQACSPVQDFCLLLQPGVAGPESSQGGLAPCFSRAGGFQCRSRVGRGGEGGPGTTGSECGPGAQGSWAMLSRVENGVRF